MDFSPLWISLKTSFIAVAAVFFIGIFAAWRVSKASRFKGLADGIFTLPMIMPPTVAGFFLLLIFGKNGAVGKFLSFFDISVVFSFSATVISSAVAAFPLMYRISRGAFEQLDKNLIYAARTLGMSERKIFFKIVLPNSSASVGAGVILSFARALGEFGSTIMFAGNIPGKTQTVSIAVYSAVQSGDRESAYKWVMIMLAISFLSITLMNSFEKHGIKFIKKPFGGDEKWGFTLILRKILAILILKFHLKREEKHLESSALPEAEKA